MCNQIVRELEQRPYNTWKNEKFPHVYKENRNGLEINVELVLLEKEPDYLHIAVCINDDDWLRKLMPVNGSFIVRSKREL